MRKIFTTLFMLVAIYTAQAQTMEFDSIGYMNMQTGKVMQKGETWIIRTGEGNAAKDYFPVNMPANLQINNQDVVFEASIGKIPPNVRMAGTPIEIKSIRKLYKTKPKDITDDKKKAENILKDSVGYVKNEKGTIMKISDTWLIDQKEKNLRYVPEYLPQEFKQEGLNVLFSGVVGKTDPNVRMMGKPLYIRELMAEEETTFNKDDVQEPLKDFYPLDSAGYLDDETGTIKKLSEYDAVFFIEIDNTRYIPLLLPQEFQQENMVVIVSGIIGKIPANVRLAGKPLDVKTIEKK